MPSLSITDFPTYFKELWGYEPFPWQARLAAQVCDSGEWPAGMALPTASGKTALIDIAIFALACELDSGHTLRRSPRRIVFVVNRRVIVDEAYERAQEIASKLRAAGPKTVLYRLAQVLRSGCAEGDKASPLACHLLRGGVFRDAAWCADPTQPAVICSTVDQVGSRVLFRGYGVAEHSRAIEAALLGEDALWLIDEAHVSRPFVQTLREVQKYRRASWVEQALPLPWALVELTATPSDPAVQPFSLDDKDFAHRLLAKRRNALKPVQVVQADKKRSLETLLHAEALKLFTSLNAKEGSAGQASVVVFANRVATARNVYSQLLKDAAKSGYALELVIGRMRGVDRDALNGKLASYGLKTGADTATRKPVIVVSTQCLECGADLDFDGLVTECASLDALRQRFGRLNRAGRDIPAAGVVVLAPSESKKPDFLYGTALTETSAWMQKEPAPDFGLAALDVRLKDVDVASMNTPTVDAPVLLPPILDAWVQTSPVPSPDPDIAPFLHGPAHDRPEVRVLWRAGLTDANATELIEAIPPVVAESVSIPLYEVERFLRSDAGESLDLGDLEHAATAISDETGGKKKTQMESRAPRRAYVKRDDHWIPIEDEPLRPGDLVVCPVETGGWSILAHVPDCPGDPSNGAGDSGKLSDMDIAEVAALRARDMLSLRIGPGLPLARLGASEAAHLRACLDSEAATAEECRSAMTDWLAAARLASSESGMTWLSDVLGKVDAKSVKAEFLQSSDTILIYWPRRLKLCDNTEEVSGRTGRQAASAPIPLDRHQMAVGKLAHRYATLVGLPTQLVNTAGISGDHHDEGKRDLRFQALLRGGDREAARFAPVLLAKSAKVPASSELRMAITTRSRLPRGFRHELLSVRLMEQCIKAGSFPDTEHELLLHLIAAHHGRCRPFAPAIADEENPTVAAVISGKSVETSSATQLERYDSGVLRRFVLLNRRYGRWGLAYLESILRLADRSVSASE